MSEVLNPLLIFLLGLIIGSFITAYTYRYPRGISFVKGRSFCPLCKKKIAWYDNIPLLSYVLLGGKCRNCGKKISPRYPLIELSSGLIFINVYYFFIGCATYVQGTTLYTNLVCGWSNALGVWTLPFLLTVVSGLIAIFVIDFEAQIIPDEVVFLLFNVTFLASLNLSGEIFYKNLLVGFGASILLLALNIFTKGRGMGLGDVKLALWGGFFLGFPTVFVWFSLSFVTGAIIGLILIVLGRARFGKQIAFGPFLVISTFLVLFWGEQISVFYYLTGYESR